MKYQLLQGNNVATLKTFPDNHFDSIVTDPPYGIDFLGKAWDSDTGSLETYQECLRVLKPGGHILAFSAARTYHHLATTIERAGFEIRDQIMWIYSSGFPKSQDVGRQLHKKANGKPDKQRFDPAIMIQTGNNFKHPNTGKLYRALPDINGNRLKKSHEGNKYGVVYEEIIVATNTKTYIPDIDDNRNVANSTTGSPRCQLCHSSTGPIWKKCPSDRSDCIKPWIPDTLNEWSGWGTQLKPAHEPIVMARKPIKLSIAQNCQTHGVGALNIDATRIPTDDPMIGGVGNKSTYENFSAENTDKVYDDITIWQPAEGGRFPSNVVGEIPDYQKYFYCPKVSRSERHIGHEMPPPMFGNVEGAYGPDGNRMAVGLDARTGNVGNNHPTVKPIDLMKYLIRLVTPAGGRVLDPFNGSGSTGCAAVELDYDYTGLELDPAYVEISRQRIEAWYKHTHKNNFNQLFTTDDN